MFQRKFNQNTQSHAKTANFKFNEQKHSNSIRWDIINDALSHDFKIDNFVEVINNKRPLRYTIKPQ